MFKKIIAFFSKKPKHDFSHYESFLSVPRMQRYLDISNGDREKALRYYLLNLELAKAFSPIIHLFEVSLRNRMNTVIGAHLGNTNWIDVLTTNSGPFAALSVLPQDNVLVKDANKIRGRLRRQGKTVTSDKLVSEMSFGYWVYCLSSIYTPVLGNCPMNAFPHKPTRYNAGSCYSHLDAIRSYRNRISHHDTLFITKVGRGAGTNTLDTAAALKVYGNILRLAEYMDPDLADIIKSHDGIGKIIRKIDRV